MDRRASFRCCALVLAAVTVAGCTGTKYVALRDAPHNPLSERLMLMSSGGPKPTDRTLVFLRRYDLESKLGGNPRELVHQVQKVIDREPSPDALSAAAELSYIGGVRSQMVLDSAQALNLYGQSVGYSYAYLFRREFWGFRNAFDPQFRGACDLYNGALEAALRAMIKQKKLQPGEPIRVEGNGTRWDIAVQPRNLPWPLEDIERFEFVSDYEINGLKNVYHTYGLGVPMIAVRKAKPHSDPIERHYAPGLSFPVTAFLRTLPDEAGQSVVQTGSVQQHRAVLELYDPLQTSEARVDARSVPLESDLTTPLGYTLSDPSFAKLDQPTTGLLFPDRVKDTTGIYMLEPYQRGKIPVLMVHGLWSSPITWMEMFNDLRGDPELRGRYQFWFFLYPTGQPFWRSATQLREALTQLRQQVDPGKREPALDQMVLVGHSMGGLISHMQIVNSRDDFWHIVSEKPIDLVKADEKARTDLMKTFYFPASTAVRRIVTIGTPHQGSRFSNEFTRYLGQRLISLPSMMSARLAEVRRQNPGYFRDTWMFDTATSIDSLAPDSPVLPVLLTAQRAPWTKYHNIVGRLPSDTFQARYFGEGDGVVPYESARLDYADTEVEVPADHSGVHRHPLAIYQTREILRQHLRELQRFPGIQQEPTQRTALRN